LHQAAEKIDVKVSGMRAIESQMNNVRKQIGALDGVSTPLLEAINDRNFWLEIIEDLNARLPKEDIWITELIATSGGKPVGGQLRGGRPEPSATALPTPARPGSATAAGPAIDGILVRGLYIFNPKQQEVVVDYFRNLVGSPHFSIDPKNQSAVMKPTTPNNTEWAFPYELRLPLRKPVKLP
jgi:type IV pilus assembly protein PilM